MRELQRKYVGNAKGKQMKCKENMKVMERKYKGIWRNEQEIQSKYK